MAILNVSEFAAVEGVRGQRVPLVAGSSAVSENVSFTGTAAASSAFQSTTGVVRVVADAACYILFGATPTAASGDIYLPANSVEYFAVPEEQDYKVSAITA